MKKYFVIFQKVAIHTFFWLLALALLTLLYGHFTGQYQITFWFVLMLMPVIMATVYFINYRLMPRFLMPGRLLKFALYFFYTLVVSVYLQLTVVVYTYINLADYQYDRMNPISSDVVFLVFGTYFIVFFASALKSVHNWSRSQQRLEQAEKAQLEAELKLKETELMVLRGQIQPHFLFNTLNNLYGLSLEKSPRLPESILQLSDILDFLLYRSDKAVIPLSDELKLIQNYIRLERLRFEDRLDFKEQIEGNPEMVQLPPFVLFTFVENAFKHGFSEDSRKLNLQMKVVLKNDYLHFFLQNSIPEIKPQRQGGLGLQNAEKRLSYFYSNFKLRTAEEAGQFKVELKLDLNSKNDGV